MVLEMNPSQVLEHVYLNNIIIAAAGDGVLSGLTVSEKGAGPDMSVDVAAGSAIISGTTYTEVSIVNLAIDAAHATLHRKDLITYDPTTSNPIVTKGTNHAGGTEDPIYPPDIPAGDILLAIVPVDATATTITTGEIIDCTIAIATSGPIAGASDVNITSVTNLEMLAWHTSSSKWINRTAAELGLATVTHDWAASDITSGILAVARGGTGVSGDTYDARYVNGCDTGTLTAQVYKIPSWTNGYVAYFNGSGIGVKPPSTDGYQWTTHGAGNAPTWAADADLIFSDTHCPKCGEEFKDGDNLVLHLIGHNEVGDILTIPMHLSCANEPKKTVMVQRKVMEDHFILDEETGELKVQQSQKTIEKTVTRHRLKEGYVIDSMTGAAHTVDDKGTKGDAVHKLTDAIEEITETIKEALYEDVEYLL